MPKKPLMAGDLAKAETSYRDALTKTPHDATMVSALVRTLLREQKVDEASAAITAEMAASPSAVALLVPSAEVSYRQGRIAEAASTADKAFHADPCNARLYLMRARIFRLNSMYSSERRAIGFARSLDPYDPDIQRTWSGTIGPDQRIEMQKKLLAVPNSMSAEERANAEKSVANLENVATKEEKVCRIASNTTSTELPMAPVINGGNFRNIGSWGLHVSVNNTETVLGVDTGASGLIINRAIAERAGLKAVARVQFYGVGDEGAQGGFVAPADSIRIGSLEFKNCMVQVTDRKDILNMDGLIGTDVFSSFLITLDYPMRKFLLAPLPPRPTDTTSSPTTLDTGAGDRPSNQTTGTGTEPQDRYIAPSMKDYYPVFRSGHDLIVPVVLNGKAERLFLVDTGSFSTTIAPDVARTVTKVHGKEAGLIRGLSGNVNNVSFSEAVNFRFAGIEQQNNDLYSFDTSGLSRGAGVEISGFLGSTLLRQLTISIDYRDGLVKFDYDPHHGNHNF